MTDRYTVAAAWILCLLTGVALSADTLVLRDGRRVEGVLIGVRDDVVEFEGQRGFFGSRERMRFDRRDVRAIELSDNGGSSGDRYRDDSRTGDINAGRNGSSRDSSDSRPAGLRERVVEVDAVAPWSDSGIDVRDGQRVYFSATGRVRWGPNRQDGPAGERNSPFNANRPIPSRSAAALIARVGESNEFFFIGDETGPIRIRGNGRLYLGVNDDFRNDNSGAFRVTVYY